MTSAILTNRSLWYLARGTGVVSLVLITAAVVLGIGGHTGSGAARVPRFATALLHRNLSLLALVLLLVHIATSVLDPFCKAHELENLYAVDGSFFPSVGGGPGGPTLTIAAQALRVARESDIAS